MAYSFSNDRQVMNLMLLSQKVNNKPKKIDRFFCPSGHDDSDECQTPSELTNKLNPDPRLVSIYSSGLNLRRVTDDSISMLTFIVSIWYDYRSHQTWQWLWSISILLTLFKYFTIPDSIVGITWALKFLKLNLGLFDNGQI